MTIGNSGEILTLAMECRFDPTIECHLSRRFGWLLWGGLRKLNLGDWWWLGGGEGPVGVRGVG